MATFGELKARLANDTRQDLILSDGGAAGESTASVAVKEAINYHSKTRFTFNVKEATLTTVISDEKLALPSDFIAPINLALIESSWQYNIKKVSYPQIQQLLNSSTMTGAPVYYAVFSGNFYFYPKPQEAYSITAGYIYNLPELSSDSDENGWLTDGYRLIYHQAMSDIYSNRLNRFDRAQYHDAKVEKEKINLIAESYELTGSFEMHSDAI